MGLGLPSITIAFKSTAITAIQRSQRGIVAMVLREDDPTTFKTGLGFFWNLTPKICFLGNYTYNMKYFDKNNIRTTYNQHSFSTGIIWKI